MEYIYVIKDYSGCSVDLAGRKIVALKDRTFFSDKDRLHFVAPVNFSKVVKVMSLDRDFLTLKVLASIIQNDAGLSDYERICDQTMLNRNVRMEIAILIRDSIPFINVMHDKHKERELARHILINKLCHQIGKIPIKDIKIEIEKIILSLYWNSDESVKEEISVLKQCIKRDQLLYDHFKDESKSLQRTCYWLYVATAFAGFGLYLSCRVSAMWWTVVFGMCFSVELYLIYKDRGSISGYKRRMQELMSENQKREKELQNIEAKLQNM